MGLCITFGYSSLADVSQQLWYNQLFIYEMSVPPQFASDFPRAAASPARRLQLRTSIHPRRHRKVASWSEIHELRQKWSVGQRPLLRPHGPTLVTNLDVETWQHGSSTEPNLYSWCSSDNTTEVLDVETVWLPFGVNFTNYYDHSKYAVAFNLPGKVILPWVCVGDINRQEHQIARGGGTMCISDPLLYNVYTSMISQTYACSGTHLPPSKNEEKAWQRTNRVPLPL